MEDFGLCVETNSKGWITRRGFIAYWMMTALLEPRRALEYLAYWGFTYQSGATCAPDNDRQYLSGMGFTSTSSDDNRVSRLYGCIDNAAKSLLRGLTITADRRMDYIRGRTNRTVFYCRVYGSRMVGKTCLLQGLLGRGLRGRGGNTVGGATGRTSAWATATGIPVCGNLRTLLLHEISAGYGEQMSTEEALSADVACLLYDSTDPESFRFVANIFLNFYRGTRVPCLFVAGKADQTSVLQNYYLDPQEFCSKYHLHDPIPFSSFDIRPRFMEGSSGPGDGARYRRSSADTVTPTDKRRTSWFLDDNDSPEASPIRSQQHNGNSSSVTPHQTRPLSATRCRSSTPSLATNSSSPSQYAPTKVELNCGFHPVYIKLTTAANFPHAKRLELAQPDYAWKLTLAATILAGFGFVAFRIVRPHF
nr:mitochondrial Rho GTPase 1 [Hymenolepis microstoma]